ncbi:hypothetical protein BGW42_005339 [Actinomortierella wolfii]|nr:hypothetical protein BGW42_005339 [Actinomortierella wolfii]
MTLRSRLARLTGTRQVGPTYATPRRRFGGFFAGYRHRRHHHHAAPVHTTAGGVPHVSGNVPGHGPINRAINTITGRGHRGHHTTATVSRPVGGGLGYRLRSLFSRRPRAHPRHAGNVVY